MPETVTETRGATAARWTVAPGYDVDEIAGLVEKMRAPEARLVKSSMARTVACVPMEQGGRVVVKHYQCRGLRDVAKAIISGSKARYEWRMAHHFLAIDIPTARPVAFAEHRRFGVAVESWLVTEEIPDAVTLRDLWESRNEAPGPSEPRPPALVEQVADLLVRLNRGRIFHSDLHAGNVLVRSVESTPMLYVLDLHAARTVPSKLAMSQILRNLVMLLGYSARSRIRAADRLRVLRHYCGSGLWPWNARKRLWSLLEARGAALNRRRLRSRSRRCLLNSSQFCTHTDRGARTYRRRDFPAEAVDAAILAHESTCKPGNPSMVKIDHKTRVSLVEVPTAQGAVKVCVKEYNGRPLIHNLRNLFTWRPTVRSWYCANALSVRGIDVATHLAARLPRNPLSSRSSYVIAAEIEEAKGFRDFVSANFANSEATASRRAFAAAVGRHFQRLHRMGVFHRDLKTTNILVVGEATGPWAFYVVDLDRVRFGRSLSRRRRARNLAQINASTPLVMSATDRLRFYHAYQGSDSWSEAGKAFIREVIEQTRQRTCVWEL